MRSLGRPSPVETGEANDRMKAWSTVREMEIKAGLLLNRSHAAHPRPGQAARNRWWLLVLRNYAATGDRLVCR